MKQHGLFCLGLVTLFVAGACQPAAEPQKPATPPAAQANTEESWQTAAKLSRKIRKDPAAAEQILTEAGTTIEDYYRLMLNVAADRDASEAYFKAAE